MDNNILLQQLQRDSKAAALLQDPKTLQRLLQSPETRQLLQMLSAQNGAALQTAAQQAGSGDPKALSAMLRKITDSKEGSQLMEQLQKQVKN